MAVSLTISIAQNSQDRDKNTSNVTVKLVANWNGGSYNILQKPGWVKIDGVQYDFTNNFNTGETLVGSKTIFSKTVDVSHNADGSKTLAVSASYTTGVSSGTITASESKALTKIPRAATLESAPNFNDEDNPRITYSNPAGSAATTLQACIASSDGGTIYAAYRDISKSGTSYTFNLSTAERTALRTAAKNARSITVKFYVKTVISGSTYYSSVSKTLSIVNANPTISPTITDTNSVAEGLTGDANKLIKYFSNAKVTFGASAQKGASVTSMKVECGSKSLTADGTINAVDSGSFKFTVIDSRGNSTTKTVTKTIVNYVKLTCGLANTEFNTDGVISFTVKGNYFNGSFGTTSNVLIVQYRYKLEDGSYGSWQATAATISGNTYSASVTISGLDYRERYVIQARAIDEISTISSAEKVMSCIPVFDWDADSFAFHVPIFLDNTKQIWYKDTAGNNVLMVSVNASNQAFFGYGMYDAGIGSTYFDGNTVNIRSKNNINNTAGGTIGGNKAWTNSSDSRLKENIEDIPKVFFDIWLELAPKVFNWNELNGGDATRHFGLIAQDVIAAFKKHGLNYKDYGFVSTAPVNGVDYYAITYEYYNMLTAQALRHTIAEVNTLKEELARIKGTIVNTEGDTDGQ
jgi:hypothetical protein